MGGVGMAAAIEALERWSEKPLLWSTIQFISHGMLDEGFTLALKRMGGGRRIIQASAELLRGDDVLQHSVAALGARGPEDNHQFARMPDVAPPEDCDAKQDDLMQRPGNLIDQFERRIARADEDAGIEYMWIRPVFETRFSAALLALMSDFFLGAHSRSRGGTSLDNTFRLCGLVETDWVLAATELSCFKNGAAHGTQRQFSQDGTLLSISSQTGLLPEQG